MLLTRNITRRLALVCLALGSIAVAGCDEDLLGPGDTGSQTQFTREITLSELEQALAAGEARLEIQLLGDGLVAGEVMLATGEALAAEEQIKSGFAALAVAEETGVLVLSLGDLEVTFNPETRFIVGNEDGLSFAQFVERIEAMLAENANLRVEARRAPSDAAQGPDDGEFVAAELRVHDGESDTRIDINVDGSNLTLNLDPADGEPDGWINVLGLSIELRVSDGVTDLGEQDADISDIVEFEGFVHSVDLETGSFSFEDGTMVFITDETEIAGGDGAGVLTSLAAVKEALEAGHDVVAYGAASVESTDPLMLVGLEIHFVIPGGDQGDDIVEFEGHVTSVSLDLGTFTLTNGTVVRLGEETDLILEGEGVSLESLGAVKEALLAGGDVIAYGNGVIEGDDPLTILALEMRFVLVSDGSANHVEFEGAVASVNLGEGAVVLADETVVFIVDTTEFLEPDVGEGLFSLEAVVDALEAQLDVIAFGVGEIETEDPLALVAIEVTFKIVQ